MGVSASSGSAAHLQHRSRRDEACGGSVHHSVMAGGHRGGLKRWDHHFISLKVLHPRPRSGVGSLADVLRLQL